MKTANRLVGLRGLRVLAACAGGVIALFAVWTYLSPIIVERIIEPTQIQHQQGQIYSTQVRTSVFWFAPSDIFRRSWEGTELRLYEDGKPLGPQRTLHAGIASQGGGRYSYWGKWLIFSTSDNSDPRSNKRRYLIRFPVYVHPAVAGPAFLVALISLTGLRQALRGVARAAPALIAVVVGLALVTGALEALLRTDFARQNLVGSYGGYDRFPERLRPTLNSLGFRDTEHAWEKPNGVIRILVLGDSMTFGHGVSDTEIWPNRLRAQLDPGVEVIVMAQNGWGTADQLHALRSQGLRFSPDLVLVGVVDNDLSPPVWEASGQQADWRLLTLVSDRLDLFRFVDFQVNRIADRMGWRYTYAEWLADTFDPLKPYLPAWQRTLDTLSAELNDAGVPGYAMILTSPVAPSDPTTVRRNEFLGRSFAERGFAVVNLRGAFVAAFGPDGGRHLWALPNDAHPGPAVHEFFARQAQALIGPKLAELRQ